MKIGAYGLAAGLAFAITASSFAQPAKPIPPRWIRKPTPESLSYAYPKVAQRYGIEGYAAFVCTVTETGSLIDCKVVEETPQGFGFGQAAISLAPIFRMAPVTLAGKPSAGGRITIPIRFIPSAAPTLPKLPRADPSAVLLARRLPYLKALGAAIERDVLSTADQAQTSQENTLSAGAREGLASALLSAMQTEHDDLLEALAVGHGAIMTRSELQAAISAQPPPDLRSPEMAKRLQAVANVVVPWYRARVFAKVQELLAQAAAARQSQGAWSNAAHTDP